MSNEQEWRRIVREHAASGMSAEAWCRSNGISKHKFYYWRTRLGSKTAEER